MLALALAGAGSGYAQQPKQPQQPQQIQPHANQAANAVVRIPSHGGSGTVIATGQGWSLILTCAHLFAAHGSYPLQPSQGELNKPIKLNLLLPSEQVSGDKKGDTKIVDVDWQHDLALLFLKDGPLPFVAPISPVEPTRGQSVLSVGFDGMRLATGGKAGTYEATTIATIDADRIWTVANPNPGRSGGPLLSGQYLIGVCQVRTGKGGGYGSWRRINELMARPKVASAIAAIAPGARAPTVESYTTPLPNIAAAPQQPKAAPRTSPQPQPQPYYQAPPQFFGQPCPGGT
jgi:Trypsin-like peptidase domain